MDREETNHTIQPLVVVETKDTCTYTTSEDVRGRVGNGCGRKRMEKKRTIDRMETWTDGWITTTKHTP